ncbi:universal stress protein [Hymenobacter sp. ASUV-10]|uniref:Universal stress protein n=1 Tax=Hymenobacter aranciens TaxID=3063996 RepID=A0ABT9B807_9BACT|nr:universal stress protein [Hymenobacter sp. ASUV-10]MDO7874395.1 universal stress protein [Hymenobacter sp. ASUV-10]
MLVLTDFHQPASVALAYAATLAQPLGARLLVVHAHRNALLDPELLTVSDSSLSAQARQPAFASLTRGLPVPAVTETIHGSVLATVAAALRRDHPELLVLGRPTDSSTPDELVSTTALDLLRAAPYPMLVVPPTAPAGRAPRRLLLAVDGESFSLGRYASMVRHLFRVLKAEVTILHVSPTPAATPLQTALASVLRIGLTIDLTRLSLARHIVASSPAAGILQAAQPGEFDLVLVIARPRSFLGKRFHHSVTAKLLLHCAVPVLVLPAQA